MLGAGRLRVIIGLLVVTCVVGVACGDETKPEVPLKSATGAVLRSLAVPGWGQLYCGRYFEAFAFATAEVSLIYSASHQHDQMKRFQKADDSSLADFYRNSRNRLIWWMAGTVLLSMGDAYVDAQLYGLDFSPQIDNKTGAVGLTVSCNF